MINLVRTSLLILFISADFITYVQSAEPSIGCFTVEKVTLDDAPKFNRDGATVLATIAKSPADGQLKFGDLIFLVGGKRIANKAEFEAAIAASEPGKALKLSYARLIDKKWKTESITLKPVDRLEMLSNAMEAKIDEVSKITTYDYRRKLHFTVDTLPMATVIARDNNVGMRVVENNGQFFLALNFCYTADTWLFVEKLTFADEANPFEVNFKFDDVKRDNSSGSIWEWSSFPLTPQQIDSLRKIIVPTMTVRMHGREYVHDYQLTQEDWVAMQTALAFYEAKKAK